MANYHLKLTPNLRTEGTEGGLDTSIHNGYSIQRTGYIEVWNSTNRKIISKVDGTAFTDAIEDWNDNPDIVAD